MHELIQHRDRLERKGRSLGIHDLHSIVVERYFDVAQRQPIESPHGFIKTLEKNSISDWFRKRGEANELQLCDEHLQHDCTNHAAIYSEIVSDPCEICCQQELKAKLFRALKVLDQNELKMIEYRFWEDLCMEEIAQRLGVSRRTAYRVLETACAKLRRHLSKAV